MNTKLPRHLIRRGLLSRADLLQLHDSKQSGGAALVANQLGLNIYLDDFQPVRVSEAAYEQFNDVQVDFLGEVETHRSGQFEQPDPLFWYLSRRESQEVEELKKPVVSVESWRNRSEELPQHTPLLGISYLLVQFLELLQHSRSSHKADISKLVKALSRAKHLSHLPRQVRKDKHRPLYIIDDRSRHLTPYWLDQHRISELLVQQAYLDLHFAVWVDGERKPRLITPQGLIDWEPPLESDVLLLSDLGALQLQGRHAHNCLILGRQLQDRNCQLFSIVPCPVAWIFPALRGLFHCLSLDDSGSSVGREEVQAMTERLLTLLSPCIRVEPALMRDMRLAVAELGEDWQIHPATEALCWQHSALQEPHSVAASWDIGERQQFLQIFKQFSAAEKNIALKTIRRWRADPELSENIWYEELLSLDATTQQLPAIAEDVVQAETKLRFVAHSVVLKQNEMSEPLQAYYRRMELRMPEECIAELGDFQRLLPYLHRDELDYDPKYINPKNLHSSASNLQEVVLFQRRNTLRLWPLEVLKQYTADNHPAYGYSPIAILKIKEGFVQVTTSQGYVLGSLSLEGKSSVVIEGHESLIVNSEWESLHLETMKAPHDSALGWDFLELFEGTQSKAGERIVISDTTNLQKPTGMQKKTRRRSVILDAVKVKELAVTKGLTNWPLFEKAVAQIFGDNNRTARKVWDGKLLDTTTAIQVSNLLGLSGYESLLVDANFHPDIILPEKLLWNVNRDPISLLLQAEYQVVPFHSRHEELEELGDWCCSHNRLSVRLYTGAGGMGKTRLAIEQCKRLRKDNWQSGFLKRLSSKQSVEDRFGAFGTMTQAVFVVVDYAETRREELVDLFKSALRAKFKLRIVLLARAAADWWNILKTERNGVGDLLTSPSSSWVTLQPLSLQKKQREGSYHLASRSFANALKKEPPLFAPESLEFDYFERVLLLHMQALIDIREQHESSTREGVQEILNAIVHREREFWKEVANTRQLPEYLHDSIGEVMARITMIGGVKDKQEAIRILDMVPLISTAQPHERAILLKLLKDLYPCHQAFQGSQAVGGNYIEPLQPDLLGECLVQIELEKNAEIILSDIFG